MSKFVIYADGGCRGNQEDDNIGGWGAHISYGNHRKELYGGQRNTTNNQMELMACIEALKIISDDTAKAVPVEIYCDSAYVVNGFKQGWVKNWIKNGWKTANKKPVKNKDLWMLLYKLVSHHENIEFIKVKGHSGNEGNERADYLVNFAMDELLTEIN